MAGNTRTNISTVEGLTSCTVYLNIDSDGTEETDYVVYDSSAVAALLGITDPLNCRINSIRSSSNSATGVFHLEWDATTDVLAFSLPYGGNTCDMDFIKIGGLPNQGGSGKTGDITLTTTGLANGDSLTLVLEVRPS